MKKAYDANGIDWLEIVIPPENDDEAEYTVKVHLTFLLSNWNCIFGSGCPGMFGKHSSVINDDAGCCVDSFYFMDTDEVDFVQEQMERLTDADWDKDLRKHVEKNGFVHQISSPDAEPEDWKAKGKVFENACVFQNRNGGSSGHTGCAFHWLSERTGEHHVDVMPQVCWQLPLRLDAEGDTYTISPWDSSQWAPDDYDFTDQERHCSWWCVDESTAYSGSQPVYKGMERELRELLGDRPYELVVGVIEQRLASGNKYPPMPGAIVNEGRTLLPLLVGNRKPRREPSYYPAFLAKMKDDIDGDTSERVDG